MSIVQFPSSPFGHFLCPAGLPSRYWPKGSQTLEAVTISCEPNTPFRKFRAPESRPKMHLVGDPLLEGTDMDEFPCTPQLSTESAEESLNARLFSMSHP